MGEYDRNREYILDDSRTMMPGLRLSLKSDIMDCRVTWCRFASSSAESLERPKHRHVVYEMHFLLNGRLNYSFPAFGACSITKGQFMLIPRDVLHSTFCDHTETEYLVIAFSLNSGCGAINRVFAEGRKPYSADFTPAMEAMLDALKAKTRTKNYASALSTKLIVRSILLEAIDSMMEPMELSLTDQCRDAASDPRIYTIERLVRENQYGEKAKGDDIAAELGMTTRQLNRICNKYFGCPIHQYITDVRIESMKRLLSDSDYTLRDISAIFGFPDVSLFIKHFTRCVGITPGKYRRGSRREDNQETADN